jgi:hypothetical protein
LTLLAHTLGEIERTAEDVAQAFVILDAPGDVALDPAKICAQFAQRLVRALELLGVRIALMGDQRMLADALIGLAQSHAVLLRQPHQAFPGAMHQLRVGWKGDGLLLHRRVDDDL